MNRLFMKKIGALYLVLILVLATGPVLTAYAGILPPAISAGVESITVTGFVSGATLKLYTSVSALVRDAGAITDSSYTFSNVEPISGGYYVTQTVEGVESSNSNFENSILRTPSISAGVGYVDVGNIYPGASFTLYYANATPVSQSPADMGGTYRYSGLNAGDSFYAQQSINGVFSSGTSLVTVQAPAKPPAPTAAAEVESIAVTGITSGATLKLYTSNGTFVRNAGTVTGSSYTIDNVEPISGGYYVTQTVEGVESSNSNFENSILRTPSISAGVGYVDVGNIYPGASFTLYYANATPVSQSPADMGGTYRYSGLNAGSSFYAQQSINGVVSPGTGLVTVQEPAAPSAAEGLESIAVTGFVSHATLKLYHWDGRLEETASDVSASSYTFENVVPDSLGYYVTQTVNGVESVNSPWVNAKLRTPSVTSGVGYVDVGNIYPGATVTLHELSGTAVSAAPALNPDGTLRFDGLPRGGWYFAVQAINGVVSEGSATIAVQYPPAPAAPASHDGIESITASGYISGATLKLYHWDGTLAATAVNVTGTAYTFTNVVPHHAGYYVTQTVDGMESVNSTWTVANVRIPTAQAGVGMVDVGNVYAGAGLRLYDAANTLVSSSPTDNGDGTFRFSGLNAGGRYYVRQIVNQLLSEASPTVTLPSLPSAPTGITASAGDGYARVKFTAPADNGGSPVLHYIVTVSPGNKTVTGTGTSIKVTGLTNGKRYTFTVKAVNAVGESVPSIASKAVTPYALEAEGDAVQPAQSVVVLVNGEVQDAGTSQTLEQDGIVMTTVTLDDAKLMRILSEKGNGATVLIPLEESVDRVSVLLNGGMIRDMMEREAVLQIQTPYVTYNLSAKDFDLAAILERFEAGTTLADIRMEIRIEEQEGDVVFGTTSLSAAMARVTLLFTKGDATVEITNVKGFVERHIPVPANISPAALVTAYVERQAGIFTSEPVTLTQENGQTFVVIK